MKRLFLLLGLTMSVLQLQASLVDVAVGDNWSGYVAHYDAYGQLSVRLTSVEPKLTGLGEYTTLNVSYEVTNWFFTYTVERIGSKACKDLTELQAVEMGHTKVDVIEDYAFSGCVRLRSVNFPSTLKHIQASAFAGCTSLPEITLPSSIQMLSYEAFAGCSALKKVTYRKDDPIALYPSVFRDISPECKLYIPFGMEETYAAKGWTKEVFKGGIVAETLFTLGGITYSITSESTVQVGSGREAAVSEWATTANVPESVTYGGKTYSVTAVAEGAFENCSRLTSITLPSTITALGDRAFAGCSGLKALSVNMTTDPAINAEMFTGIEGCKLYVPKEWSSAYSWGTYFWPIIRGETFTAIVNDVETTFLITSENTVQLGDASVAIPTDYSGAYAIPETVEHEGTTYTVTAIAREAFKGIKQLTSIVMPATILKADTWFAGQCSALKSVTLSPNLTYLGISAFYEDAALEKIELPSSLSTIENFCFYKCTGLTEVVIPEGVEQINRAAFLYCSGLKTLTLPSTLKDMGDDYYRACFTSLTNLETVYANAIVPPVNNSSFSANNAKLIVPQGTRDAYIAAGWTEDVFKGGVSEDGILHGKTAESVTFRAKIIEGNNVTVSIDKDFTPAIDTATEGSITLPSSFEYLGQTYYVTQIGEGAFDGCKGITSVTIPEGVTLIKYMAFKECDNLENVSLPSTLKTIGNAAFKACAISSIILPDGLNSLQTNAFQDCKNLTTITLPSGLKTIGTNVFNGTNLLAVYSKLTEPFQLQREGAFNPRPDDMNPVVLYVPYGTHQRYLDKGWTENSGTTNGAVYRIVEENVEKNHTFIQTGKGATVIIETGVNGISQAYPLADAKAWQAYLTKGGYGYINYRAEEGYTVKILRNGVDVGDAYDVDEDTLSGEDYNFITLKDDDLDDQVTWQVVVTRDNAAYDTNGDGKVTIADVTKLVNVILGKE